MSEAMFKLKIRAQDHGRFMKGEAIVACLRQAIVSKAAADQMDARNLGQKLLDPAGKMEARMVNIDVPFNWIRSPFDVGIDSCVIQKPVEKEKEDDGREE